VIVRRARREGCAVTIVPDDLPARDLGFCGEVQRALIDGVEYDLGLRGAHQVQNATCAVAALRALNLASGEALASGLKNTAWPARFEVISHEPITVVDGAHNPDGAKRLAETWKSFLTSIQPATSALSTHLVFGAVADKDPADVARILAPLAAKVSLVRLQNERSCDPRDLVPLFPRADVKTYDSVADWWRQRHPAPGGPVLIAGSLFLAGEVLALREGKTEDCDLNERLGKTLTR
jgi:dihydrofolate synthase/folylpolyglutamate synthase